MKKWQIQAPENSHNIKIDITVVFFFFFLKCLNRFSLTATALFIPNWMKKCMWHLLFLPDKTSISVLGSSVKIPRRHPDRWCFLHLIAARVSFWMLPNKQAAAHWKALTLIWSRNTGCRLSFLIMQPALTFPLWRLFWRFPFAFEYSSVFFLSVISAAKPAARSLCSAPNIHVEHEHLEQPGCVKVLWGLCRIGRDSTQSDSVADRWCKSLIPFLASQYLSACFPFYFLTMSQAFSIYPWKIPS